MPVTYDAIIVGARCAGSATAMLLARKGYRVLVVDRAHFPSDTLSAHALRIPAVAKLRKWGLFDAMVALGAPPIRDVRIDFGPVALTGAALPLGGADAMYAPRRYLLDTLLADAAVRAGAELREGFTVLGLVYDGDRVAGIRGRTAGGVEVTERAKVVIGADGLRSVVARMVDAPAYATHPTLTCAYYTYFEDVPVLADGELYIRDGSFVLAVPTNHGLTQVAFLRPVADFGAIRTNIDAELFATVAGASASLGERVRGGRRVERFYGTADMPFFARKPYGPGWMLAGDAGCHKDPIMAQGMKDALYSAELAAEALDDVFAGRSSFEAAGARYEAVRNEHAMPLFQLAQQFATLAPPPPEMQAVFAALPGNQADTNRLFSVMEGTFPVAEFFDPANLERIVRGGTPELLKAS
ncbi:MAG: oxidoreductase [Candidatus Eremiobacteraeota bacterium]|nr:oxidoreductase [Candidatus Eremiobacteraeota bacterium]